MLARPSQDRPLSLWGGKPLWTGYRLIRLRGQGGFGQVWEVETPEGKRAALKFIQCHDYLTAAEEVRNILRIKQLSHPHFVRLDNVFADRGYVVVAMDLAEGSLNDLFHVAWSEGGLLPGTLVCDYLSQAARAIDFLNERRHDVDGQRVAIQHGDIKPGNLLLFGDTIKLCDFGLSRMLTCDMASHRRAGTLAYAAPEIFKGQISRWSDQYSLAVTYFESRTGKFPFPRNPSQFTRTYVRPEPDLSAIPSAERNILQRALSNQPSHRWPDCSSLLAALTQAVAAETRMAG